MNSTSYNGPSLTVGGRTFTDLANLKILATANDSATYSTFYNASSISVTRAPYQVPVGKTFILHAVRFNMLSAAGANAGGFFLIYGDNSVGMGGAAPTNPIGMISGTAGANSADAPFALGGGFIGKYEMAIGGHAPANKYITSQNAFAGTFGRVTIFGYEIDA